VKHATLVNAVSTIQGASFIGIDTHTEVKLTGGKKNPMQGRVTKRMIGAAVQAFTNTNVNAYAAMVQRRLVAEGKPATDFTLSERAWGTRVPNMPIVEHNGAYYLEAIFHKPGNSEYLLDGHPIAASDIQGLPAATAGEQGGLEDKVIIRTFKAESITELRINGQAFN
jgi:hypothetical protein